MTTSFVYTASDFVEEVNWNSLKHHELSKFDNELRTKWAEAMAKGYFRYDFGELETRILSGKHGYVLQLNCRRGVERRPPESITSLQVPFDGSRFNFTRVPAHEILFNLHRSDGDKQQTVGEQHSVLINVSPLEFGHVLLIPNIDSSLPQVLTLKSIELSLNLVLLSGHPGFRIGFNSLCALASVNHLHLHAWYLEHHLYTETAAVKQVQGELFELSDCVTQGFVLQLHNSSVSTLSRCVFKVVDYLQSSGIAHNVFFTRAALFNDVNDSRSNVRVYVWPRRPYLGKKAITADTIEVFNVAVCELAGHMPVYVASKFHEITEEYVDGRLRDEMLPKDEFDHLRDGIKKVLLDDDEPGHSVANDSSAGHVY